MKFGWILSAAVVTLVAAQARASIVFTSILDGDNERPSPVAGDGAGSATAMLSGDSGSYVLLYTLNYAGLSSDAVAGHIHYSILPPGQDPAEQTGPVVHGLDADFTALGTSGTVSGQWRFDDAALPLTDALADSLLDGELYFNLHTAIHPDGEIRGQLQAVGGSTDGGTPNATVIPLPPAVLVGLAGLGAAGWAMRRRRAITG
jgi:hypothetical protein